MVIRFVPRNRGMAGVVQLMVPVAVPVGPMAFVHVTSVTPTLSLLDPRKTIDGALVPTVVAAGKLICRDGATVSRPEAAVRTSMDREADSPSPP
jgi:hypothetical protein